VGEEGFDLVTSATALHWIDEAIRYRKIARMLKPGGAVAPFWNTHVHTDKDRGFFEEVQSVYLRVVPEMAKIPELLARPEHVPADEPGRIEATGLYGPVTVRRYPFDVDYDAASYIRLLNTYSDHRALESDVRGRLFEGIAGLIDTEYGGYITKGYVATLYVAHRT
jgi:SAM-dependent methyltransferase